ncbi:MAG: hypothetical protein R3230_00425 [Nitrosopumilaceae archaeon]|nr:hypothetical protein [Nitrosopumilaceae archaeon]
MSNVNFAELHKKVSIAVCKHDADFLENHEECIDFGHCGYAVVLLSFGRKRKIKNQFIEHNLINENRTWEMYGRKEYVIELPPHAVPTQYMGFFEGRAEAAAKILREELDGTGIEVNIHRWVD